MYIKKDNKICFTCKGDMIQSRNGKRKFCANCQKEKKRKRDSKRKQTIKYKEYQRNYNKKRRLEIRFIVLQRDNFKCIYCGVGANESKLQIDHIYPKSKQGLDRIENYQTLCINCNKGKSDIILNEFLK